MSEHTITKEAYEGDIVSRLRNWRGLHLAHGGALFEEAADLIESQRLLIDLQATSNQATRKRLEGEIEKLRQAATGTKRDINVVDREPKPLLAVIECEGRLTPDQRQSIGDAWKACLDLDPAIPPCIIVERGLKVTFQTALDP